MMTQLDKLKPTYPAVLGNRVTLSNALVASAQGLTLAEKRLVMMAVSQIDSRKSDSKQLVVRLAAKDFAEAFDIAPHTAYEQLKAAGDHLYQRSILMQETTPKGKPIITKMRWIGRAKYHENEGWIELAFHYEVVPHLTLLKKRFTSYQLQQAAALRSLYSWRLLEMVMQYQSTGWMEIDIEDFCDAMEATEKQRANFNNVKRRIIEPAVKELREKDNWDITWSPIKGGRRVKALRFEFRKDPQERMF